MRQFTRLANSFLKKTDRHADMQSLYFVHDNFCRTHQALRVSPAMAAGVSDTLRDMNWIVRLIDARTPEPQKPRPRPGAGERPRKSK